MTRAGGEVTGPMVTLGCFRPTTWNLSNKGSSPGGGGWVASDVWKTNFPQNHFLGNEAVYVFVCLFFWREGGHSFVPPLLAKTLCICLVKRILFLLCSFSLTRFQIEMDLILGDTQYFRLFREREEDHVVGRALDENRSLRTHMDRGTLEYQPGLFWRKGSNGSHVCRPFLFFQSAYCNFARERKRAVIIKRCRP